MGLLSDALLREVAGWTPRIAAVLRGDGLAPAVVDGSCARVKTALGNMLRDAEGLWVLAPHEDATSEFALTSWGERRSSVRLDRVFLAGREPLDAGDDCLWIVDYKTATHGREGVEEFLAEERVKYAAQMESLCASDARIAWRQGGCGWGCTIRCCRGWSGGSRR